MKRIVTLFEWTLFLPALMPLFYVQGMMYPLLTPKVLALRALGIIAFALFTYLVMSGRQFFWNRLKRWETWLPALLLALAYTSSIFGVDFYHSFWSTFERGDGLLTLTVCVGYFYLLLLSAKAEWMPRLFKIVAWTGSLAALYLVFQWIETTMAVNLPFIVKPNGRIGGTMGNAAFMAAYLGMTFFATLAAAREYIGWKRNILYAGAGLQLFAILLTATRGTILALIIAGIVYLIYLAWSREGRQRSWAAGALIAFVALGGLFFAFRTELAQIPFEPIHRIASISFSDPTVSSRLFIWRSVSIEAMSRPLLGYGAEHISVPFDKVYDPSIMIEEWFDRSHNAYLDYFVQFGIGGLILYISLITLLVYTGRRIRKEGNKYGTFLLGIAGVYAVQNFFVFDTIVTLWLLITFSAIARAYRSNEDPSALMRPWPFAGALTGAIILLFIIPVAVRPLQANLLAFEAYQYQIVDLPRAKVAANRGIALNTYADLEFGYNAYFIYTEEQKNRLSGETLRAAYENAVVLLRHNFGRYAYDARTAVYFAQVLSLVPQGIAVDRETLSSALERATRLSPKRYQPWYILANLSISDANTHLPKSPERLAGYSAAQDILTKYIALVPALSAPHFVLAQLLYASGKTAEAADEAAKGKVRYTSDLETARRAASYYENVLDLPNAAFFLKEIIQLDPTNTAAADDFAKIQAYEQSKK